MVTISSLSFRRSAACWRCTWAVTVRCAAATWFHDFAFCGVVVATRFLISSVFVRIRCRTLSSVSIYYVLVTCRNLATTRCSSFSSTFIKSFISLRIFTAFSVILIISAMISIIWLGCGCCFVAGYGVALSPTRSTRPSRGAFLTIFEWF